MKNGLDEATQFAIYKSQKSKLLSIFKKQGDANSLNFVYDKLLWKCKKLFKEMDILFKFTKMKDISTL